MDLVALVLMRSISRSFSQPRPQKLVVGIGQQVLRLLQELSLSVFIRAHSWLKVGSPQHAVPEKLAHQ